MLGSILQWSIWTWRFFFKMFNYIFILFYMYRTYKSILCWINYHGSFQGIISFHANYLICLNYFLSSFDCSRICTYMPYFTSGIGNISIFSVSSFFHSTVDGTPGCSTAELHPQPFLFWDRTSLSCSGWSWTYDPPSSASSVAGNTSIIAILFWSL